MASETRSAGAASSRRRLTGSARSSRPAAAVAAPSPAASVARERRAVGAARRARRLRPQRLVHDRGRALHVQLGRLHRPREHRRVQEALQHHRLDVRHLRLERGAADEARRAARPASTTSAARPPSTSSEMAEEGFIEKIDWSTRSRTRSYINPNFQSFSIVRARTTKYNSTTARRTGARPASSIRTKVVTEEVKTWKDFFEIAPKYSGRIVVVDSPGDVFTAPLKALGYSLNSIDPRRAGAGARAAAWASPRTSSRSTRTTTRSRSKTEEAVLGLIWTGGVVEPARRPGDRGHRVHHPRGRDAVLDGHLGAALRTHRIPRPALALLNFIHEPADPGDRDRDQPLRHAERRGEEARRPGDPQRPDRVRPARRSSAASRARRTSRPTRPREIWEEFSSSIGG